MRDSTVFGIDGMTSVKRVNWWVIAGLCFCLLAWGGGALVLTKTVSLYAHRSNAGFRHDFIEHARGHWLSVKHVVAPPAPRTNPT